MQTPFDRLAPGAGCTPLDTAPSPARAALFLDFDGVLVDIAARPDAIEVPARLVPLLQHIERATGGALALVSGRPIRDIRGHLGQTPAHVAGCHGGEREGPSGHVAHPLSDGDAVRSVQAGVQALAAAAHGLLAEDKPLGAVIHYRARPELHARLHRAAERIAAAHPGFDCHRAKMAFELRPRGVGKDHMIAEWMAGRPFAGRVPVFLGDDLTDEPALDWVQPQGGVAIKVGPGDSVARHRLSGPVAVLDGLSRWSAWQERPEPP